MNGAGDIAALAIPFAAGAAAGAFTAGLAAGTESLWILPSVLLPALLLLTPLLVSGRGRMPAYALAFFLLGAFCTLSRALVPGASAPLAFAAKACDVLKRAIDGIPFRDARSSSLVRALLTGDRSGLDRGTVEAFRNSGAAHILALSGLHLGLIYLLVRRILGLLGASPAARRIRCTLTIGATAFYTLMTGAGPSTVRAFLYICINEFLSLSPGRRKDPARILLAALTIQLVLQPTAISGTGFQLSYLAMLGIAILMPRMQAWYPAARTSLERADPMRRIWNAAALTISCQVFTAPLVLLRFHTFPKHFLLTNLLALPLGSAIMLFSVLLLILGAAGIRPDLLVRADEGLIRSLLFVLETISSL